MLLDHLKKKIHQLTSYYQSIVSISVQKEDILVVEIKKTIREIQVIKSGQYKNAEDVIDLINSDFNLKDKRLSINFYPPNGSYKLIEVPKMPQAEIETWLFDNATDFLPTGLSLNELYLTYKIVRTDEMMILLLGIFNKTEINTFFEKLKNTEAILCNIFPGLLNSIKVSTEEEEEPGIQNYYLEHDDYHELIIYENESLLYYNQIPKAFQAANKVDSVQRLFNSDIDLLNAEINSDNLKVIVIENGIENDIEKENSIANSFALAELNKKDTFNLLPQEMLLDSAIVSWKQIFLRFSLAAGISVFFTYLLAFILVFIAGNLKQGIEEDREILAPQLSQVDSLRSSKLMLEKDLRAAHQVKKYRSNTSILLQILSFHIPKNCWLTEIFYNEESDKPFNTILKGMSKDESKINSFLQNLESDENIKNVKLDFINNLSSDEMYRDWKIRSSKYIEFQISVEY